MRTAIRAAVADFAWVYCRPSILSVVLITKKKKESALTIDTLLDAFRWCNHATSEGNHPCSSCSVELQTQSARRSDEILTSVSFALALCDPVTRRCGDLTQNLARIVTVLLRSAVDVTRAFEI